MKIPNVVVLSATPTMHEPENGTPKRGTLADLGSDLLTLGVLTTVCIGAGLAINQIRDQPLPLLYVSKEGRMEQAVSKLAVGNLDSPSAAKERPVSEGAAVPGRSPQVIGIAEFRAFVEAKRGVVLDARPEIFHRLGHITGALSVSREEFEGDYAKQRALLEPWRDKAVAVYCSSESCEDSQMVADALAKLGYRHILVFKGGWDEWTRAGLPEEHQ